MKKIFTSESVCKGHPDKVCDQISDAIVDAILLHDKNAHTAVESVASYDTLVIMGEVKTNQVIDYEKIARNVIKSIGYNDSRWGFEYDKIEVINKIHTQSSDIDMGVSHGEKVHAGDQGMMFGYANNETEGNMPLAFDLANKICKQLDDIKKVFSYLGPDGKAQVSVEYIDNKISRIDTIVVSNQHDEKIDLSTLKADIKKHVIDKVIPSELIDDNTKIFINPTGRFVIGGPVGDSGLTGRKIICDSYGSYALAGGGAFSGKDPSKVDRSGAYYTRYIANHLVALDLASEVMIQVAYCIGEEKPVSLYIDTKGTNKVDMEVLYDVVNKFFDLSVTNIIKELDLYNQRYLPLASYGHFGRLDVMPSFEKLDKLDAIKAYLA